MSALATESVELRERGGAIPSARLLPLLDRYAKTGAIPSSSLDRRIYKVRHEAICVSLDFADRLLIDIGLEHEWHGELGDLYETADNPTLFSVGGPPPKLPRSKLKHVHTLYQGGMSIPRIAELLYDSYGYANAHSCESSLKRAFFMAGYKRRTKAEAAQLHYRDARCAGCGCAMVKRSPGCAACTRRHFRYRQLGKPYVPTKCVGCGVPHEERSRGCGDCTSRHHRRRLRGAPYVEPQAGCVRCGVPYEDRTPGCLACRKRANRRACRLSTRAPVEASPPCSSGGTHLPERSAA